MPAEDGGRYQTKSGTSLKIRLARAKLFGYVLDGGNRTGDVDFFAGIQDIHADFAIHSAHLNVLLLRAILNLDEIGLRMLLEALRHSANDGKPFVGVHFGLLELVVGNKVQGHGHDRSGNPQMDVGTTLVMFIHVHANGSLAEGIDGGQGERTDGAESGFCKNHHRSCTSSFRDILGINPHSDGVVVALDADEFGVAAGGKGAESGEDIELILGA
jgi:hypothetical protein